MTESRGNRTSSPRLPLHASQIPIEAKKKNRSNRRGRHDVREPLKGSPAAVPDSPMPPTREPNVGKTKETGKQGKRKTDNLRLIKTGTRRANCAQCGKKGHELRCREWTCFDCDERASSAENAQDSSRRKCSFGMVEDAAPAFYVANCVKMRTMTIGGPSSQLDIYLHIFTRQVACLECRGHCPTMCKQDLVVYYRLIPF